MNYLDTGVIVSAVYLRDPYQERCAALLEDGVASTHAFAEAFATLTGQYRVQNETATESLLSVADIVRIEEMTRQDYLGAIKETKARGVMGGLIYDALHAAVARRLKVAKLYTFNLSNFQHVAPDLVVAKP